MKRILAGLLVALLLPVATRAEEKRPAAEKPAFSTFKEAVAFISECLDKKEDHRLSEACATPFERQADTKALLESLRGTHLRTPLPKLYEGKDFPSEGRAFTLGGCHKELGNVHIDFERVDKGWRLSRIWICW